MELNIRTKTNLFTLKEKCDHIKPVEENELIHFVAVIPHRKKVYKKNIFGKKLEEFDLKVELEKKILLTVPKSEYLYSYDPKVAEPMGE